MHTVTVLGGSGVAGQAIARFLLERDDITIQLAGRTESKLVQAAESLPQDRVRITPVDTRNTAALTQVLTDVELVVVAAPVLDHCGDIARVALGTGTNWLDILLDVPIKQDALSPLSPDFTQAGLSLITGTGVHPGLPGAMIRAVADQFSPVRTAQAGMLLAVDWGKDDYTQATQEEFAIEGASFKAAGWINGQYQSYSWLNPRSIRRIDFDQPFGKRDCVLMELKEIRDLRGIYPNLDNACFAIAGFSPIVDWLIMPLSLAMITVSPRLAAPASRLLFNSLRRFSKPPYGAVVTVDAGGDGHEPIRLTVSHEDAYWLTSAVASATACQMLDGVITEPGLHQAGLVVDPRRLLTDLASLGAHVEEQKVWE
ncbi:MAG: saccharopine dehydrogenase NADP-binding domain-containing protein [Propionibacteriaceae bacterium]|nr:saccharopine dehydrogenase NADP-binding domain-containing protein [Propionibacteriaceae bacterium]